MTMNRFFWITDEKFKYINPEGFEIKVNIEKDFKEKGFNVV